MREVVIQAIRTGMTWVCLVLVALIGGLLLAGLYISVAFIVVSPVLLFVYIIVQIIK